MRTIKRLIFPICLILIGIGIFILGSWDMQHAVAAQPDAWFGGSNIPVPNAFYGSTHCADQPNSFYVVAGWSSYFVNRDDVYRFDADTNTWHELASFPEEMGAPSVTCYQGNLYAGGGNLEAYDTSNHFYLYNITSDVWTQLEDLPRRQNGAALAAWDGYLYLIGGTDDAVAPIYPTPQVDRYNLWTGEWEINWGDPMPALTVGNWLQAGQYVFIVGGFTSDYPQNSDATLRYDLVSGSWEVGPSFTSRRAMMALDITSQYLYAIGGDANGGGATDPMDMVERLDLSLWPGGAWEDISDPLPAVRTANYGFCSQDLQGGKIWSAGGLSISDNPTVETYYRTTEPCADFYFGDLTREAWELGNHPGAAAHYALPVVNDGTLVDIYDISVSSTWIITSPATLGLIAPGEAGLLMVDVLVPPDAEPDDFDTAVITVTSQGDPDSHDTAVLTTSVTDWQDSTSLPQPLAYPTKAQCSDDPTDFYILGGYNYWLNPSSTIYHFDGTEWDQITTLPYPWSGLAAVCYDQKLYIAGGDQIRLDVYDLMENTWTRLADPPRYVWEAGIGAWDGQLFLIGGGYESLVPVDNVDIYDIASDTWSAGPPMTVPDFAYGYTQAGPYLYVVGGASGDFNHNLNVTARLNLATQEWETGPTFTSQRAITSVVATQSHLYAYGGDINGYERLDTIGLVEVLDLSQWPDGTWEDIHQPMPWALESNGGGFCTDTVTGGRIWSVGGITGIWMPSGYIWYEMIDNNYYLPIGEACVQNIINLSDMPMYGPGEPGSTVTYTIDITNTGNVIDYYNLFVSHEWPEGLSTGGPGPVEPGETIQVDIVIDIPAEAKFGDVITTTIRVESLRDPNIMDSMQIFTTVVPTYNRVFLPLAIKP